MRRRDFIGLAGVAAGWPLVARAQADRRVQRIGVLLPGTEGDTQLTKYLQAFNSGLRELGWINGQNVRIEYHWAQGDVARAQSLAKEMVNPPPAVIVTSGKRFGAIGPPCRLSVVLTRYLDFWRAQMPASCISRAMRLRRPGQPSSRAKRGLP